MFPYPSGAGLHVGHPKGYTATDIVSRYYHATGHNVLHTMGFDAFGLPAENYAIKTGTHPALTTAANIEVFTKQLQSLGFSYDWDRMVDTTSPEYYQWTQWIFLELFKRWLAYEQDLPINYCPSCKTGLANEEVTALNTCDRCGTRVEKRALRQWVLKITEYADRLIDDLDGLDWPEGVKEMQKNWIGKSEGCEFRMLKKVEWKPTALILHGFGGKWGDHWGAWLSWELGKIGYEVYMPTIPFDSGNIDTCLQSLQELRGKLDENSMIIWHSMGSHLAIKLIESLDFPISTFVSVAGAFEWMSHKKAFANSDRLKALWDIHGSLVHTQTDYQKVRKNIQKSILITSNNDPLIDQNEQKEYFSKNNLLDTYIVLNEKSHFSISRGNVTKIPELLTEVFDYISVYTTRIDTVYGMTYAVLAPDHPRVYDFITDEQSIECEAYITEAASRSDQDRTNEWKEKTGVFTGSYVINPYNGEPVQLWIADYVLGHYGTGAVMAVPAHDERDFAFAKKYDLPIRQSIARKSIPDPFYAPKDGVETLKRITVEIILENEHSEVCLLSERASGREDIYLPGGWVEEWETELEAVEKEIIEETGYTDFEIIGPVDNSYRHGFFHRHLKNKNQDMIGRAWYVRLNSNARIHCEVDEGKHEMRWVKKETVAEVMNWKDHLESYWSVFCGWFQYLWEDGFLVNSSWFDWLTSAEARKVLTQKAETEGFGKKKVNYKLRDWLFSRQRYWGEPIPLIHLAIEDVKRLPHIADISQATDMNIAYILKRNPIEWENTRGTLCHGKVRELIIGGKVFSQIYDGITGKLIIDSRLPLTLPAVDKYEPAGDGQSPLATVPSFVNVKLADNLDGKRETNTMPQWGGSCWYYLRYMDPENPDNLASKEALGYWQNVDEYVGWAEHAVLHLLYARFWHKVLYDIGVVPTIEPFQKLTNVGMILAYAYERADGWLVAVDLVEEKEWKYFETSTGKEVKQVVAKMSKSLKNVVNPNDIVGEYGADTLRLYEMSMSAFTDTAPWNPDAIIGVRRLLDKAYSMVIEWKNQAKDDMKAMKLLHKTIKKVWEDIVDYKFNTAIAALQILLNEWLPQDREFAQEWKEKFSIILHPFAPHMAEELYNLLLKGGAEERGGGFPDAQKILSPSDSSSQKNSLSIYDAPWPEFDDFMLVDDEVTIAIQVNGKLRGTLVCLNWVSQEEVSVAAMSEPSIAKWIEWKIIVKEIFIPNKMLSIVIR